MCVKIRKRGKEKRETLGNWRNGRVRKEIRSLGFETKKRSCFFPTLPLHKPPQSLPIPPLFFHVFRVLRCCTPLLYIWELGRRRRAKAIFRFLFCPFFCYYPALTLPTSRFNLLSFFIFYFFMWILAFWTFSFRFHLSFFPTWLMMDVYGSLSNVKRESHLYRIMLYL